MNPQSLTPTQIAKILDTLEVLNQIGDAVKLHAVQLAHKGVKIPGWEASWTNTQRKWTGEDEANALLTDLGLETKQRYNITLLSPAQAEDVLKKAGKWPKKQRGVKQEFTPLDKVVERTQPNPAIRKAQ